MASFECAGLDELINNMRALGQDCGPVAVEMVEAASEIIRDGWKESAEAHGHVDTGAMVNSIVAGTPVQAGDICFNDIYPQGSDGKGVRNATKAFILHYGKHNIPASHWVDDAEDKSAGPSESACQVIWDSFLASRG